MKRALDAQNMDSNELSLLDIVPPEIIVMILREATVYNGNNDFFVTMTCRLTCNAFNTIVNDELCHRRGDAFAFNFETKEYDLPWWHDYALVMAAARRNLFSPYFYWLKSDRLTCIGFQGIDIVRAYCQCRLMDQAREALNLFTISVLHLNEYHQELCFLNNNNKKLQWLTDYMLKRFPQRHVTIHYRLRTFFLDTFCLDSSVDWYGSVRFMWHESRATMANILCRVPYTVSSITLQPTWDSFCLDTNQVMAMASNERPELELRCLPVPPPEDESDHLLN